MSSAEQHHHAREAVRAKARRVIADTWQSQANLSLFLAVLVAFSFVAPVLGFGHHNIKLYADIGFTLMMVSGVAIAWGHPKLMTVAAIVGAVAVAYRWANFFRPSPTLQVYADGSSIVAILIIAIVLLAQVFGPGRVTHVRIQGAIAAYLLFGAGYAHAYHIVASLQPEAFRSTVGSMSGVGDWIYFSYVTLTTVGYGDILPATTTARLLCVGEALTGQLYLAVLIARLVAMEVISWQEGKNHRDS
jgi:Ion channel